MPQAKVDKCTCHLLALCLIIGAFAVDCNVMAADLAMQARTLQTYFRTLGCQIMDMKSHKEARLTVPLKFPEVRQRRKRAR